MEEAVRERLQETVAELPAVDVHTHLGTGGRRCSETLAELVSYHWLQTELIRAGASLSTAEAIGDPSAYMEKAAPFFDAIYNTANAYCFRRILADLYGVRERQITAKNWRGVDEVVRTESRKPDWMTRVLDRAGVQAVAVRYLEAANDPTGRFWRYVEGEALWAPTTLRTLRQLNVDPAQGAEGVRDAIRRKIQELVKVSGARALHVWARDSWTYVPSSPSLVETALQRVAQDPAAADGAAEDVLTSFGAETVSEVAGELGVTIQLFHGMWRYGQDRNLPLVGSYWNPGFLRGLVALARRYSKTRYDVFLATRIPSHEAASLCRILPHVSVSGGWWHGFTPTTLRAFYRDRLEMLPSTAWNAFYSDAYRVEWIYGKAVLARQCLARELAAMIEDGFLDEPAAVHIARRLLGENAMHIYRLQEEDSGESSGAPRLVTASSGE